MRTKDAVSWVGMGRIRPAPHHRLRHGDVAVWYGCTARLSASELAAMDASLASAERARRDRFVFERDRREFTAAHALLRQALSWYGHMPPAAWQFEANEFGKPALVPAQIQATQLTFNLSHAHGIVACAVSRGRTIGIDVETCERGARLLDIAGGYFTPAERTQVSALPAVEVPTRLTELWTLKEAYVKAIGAGLSTSLNVFGFLLDDRSGVRLAGVADAESWRFWLASLPEARVAVAVAPGDTTDRVSFHRVSDDTPEVQILRTTDPQAIT